jgi:hypothetical protein
MTVALSNGAPTLPTISSRAKTTAATANREPLDQRRLRSTIAMRMTTKPASRGR